MQQFNLTSINSEDIYNMVYDTPLLDRTNNQYLDKFKIHYKKTPAFLIYDNPDYEQIITESTSANINYLSNHIKFSIGTASSPLQIIELKQNVQNILLSFLVSNEYQSINIRHQDILDAISFLNSLPENCILPVPILADDGEISFNWSKNDFHIDIIFTGNCCYSYFAKDNFGKKYYGDDISILNKLPSELSTLLMDFFAKYDEI